MLGQESLDPRVFLLRSFLSRVLNFYDLFDLLGAKTVGLHVLGVMSDVLQSLLLVIVLGN